MSLVDLQRDVLRVCTEADTPREPLARLGDERIWGIYRGMVRRRLLGELKHAYKRSHAAAGDALFLDAFAHYMATDPPRARYFHAVPGTFERSAVAFFGSAEGAPAFLPDLVRFEAARWAVSDVDDRISEPDAVGELSFDGRPVLNPALRLLALDYAVHRKAEEGRYEQGRYYVALHRGGDDQPVRVWNLNRVGHALLVELQREPRSMTEAVQALATRLKIAVDDSFLEGLCTTLADFSERRILLGSRAA